MIGALTNPYADLQDALYELKREVREYYSEDEDDDWLYP